MTTRAINPALWLTLGLAAANGFAAAGPGGETIRFLEARVQSDPLDSIAQNRLSSAYILELRETGDLACLDGALRCARASLRAVPAPQNPGGLAVLAVAEFESHHFNEALALAQRAFATDPRNTGARATAGDAQLELGHYAEAGNIYDELETDGSTPPVLARQARLAELRGDAPRAIGLLREITGQPGEDAWYRVRLGELYFRAGDFANAEEQYEAGRRLRPEHFLVLEHLAELRAAQGRYEEAVALYQHVIRLTSRAEFCQALGDLYSFMGRPAEAKPWHDRALQGYLKSVEGGNAHYFHHLAGFYSDVQENPAEALRWARKDFEVRQNVYARDTLAWALYKNGAFAAAAEEIARALDTGTQDPHVLFHAAMIYSRAGELDRGAALLKKTLTLNSRYNSFHVHR